MADDKTGRKPGDVNAPASPRKFATRSSRTPILELPRSVIANSVGLTFPAQLTEKDWQEAGRELGRAGGSLQWWIGDWWAYGEHRYGERMALVEADDWVGPSFQACMDCAAVARAFETSRRREVLTFTHHREVTSLPPAEADLLLDEAEADGLTIRALRERVRQVKASRAAEGEKFTGAAVRQTLAAEHGLSFARRGLAPGEVAPLPAEVRYERRDDPPPRVVDQVRYLRDEEEAPAVHTADDYAQARLERKASELWQTCASFTDLARSPDIAVVLAVRSGAEQDQLIRDVETAAARLKAGRETNVVRGGKLN
jgi:hypothetical protein